MATESRLSAPDYLALGLLATALLNFDGMITVLSQTRETHQPVFNNFSILFFYALPVSLYLLPRYARISNMGDIFGLFLLFIALYFIGSLVPILVAGDIQAGLIDNLRAVISAVILVSTFYFWAATLSDAALVNVLRIAKILLLIGSFSTIFSFNFTFYQSPVGLDRVGGFYIDENEAAVVALWCLVLVVAFPARSRLLTLAQGSIALAALALTFSRMGILVFLLLCLFFLFDRPSIKTTVLFIIGIALFTWALWLVFEHDLFGLSSHQRGRLSDVIDIVTGQATERTVGPRAILFDAGQRKIAEVFPWGAGLGKFHVLEGVLPSSTTGWLGVHNVYLMVLGEAGFPAFMAFLAFWARTIWKLVDSPFRVFAMGTTVVMLSSMMTMHSLFGNRVWLAMLSFVMVTAARSPRSRKTSLAPETLLGSSPP